MAFGNLIKQLKRQAPSGQNLAGSYALTRQTKTTKPDKEICDAKRQRDPDPSLE
jgi:hypothetical protein